MENHSCFRLWDSLQFEYQEFQRSSSTKHEPPSALPVQASTPEMIEKIGKMILDDRRMKIRDKVESQGYRKVQTLQFCMKSH